MRPPLFCRARRRLGHLVDGVLALAGFELRPTPGRVPKAAPAHVLPDGRFFSYRENAEAGAANLRVKLDREASDGPFEWPDIVAINQAVARLIGGEIRIAELGGGTGRFAWEASSEPRRSIVSSEFDADASAWARSHRSRPNIRYVTAPLTPQDGPFDVAVSIEVVEHVRNYPAFLANIAMLAPRAIITTPSKLRPGAGDPAGPPSYEQHVREWTPGEFFWVLRCYFDDVRLYTLPDPLVPELEAIMVSDLRSPLIADCRQPCGPAG